MANKQSFTRDEWIKILESPVLTGMAVSAAHYQGSCCESVSNKLIDAGAQL